MRFATHRHFFFSREETVLLPATQVSHPQPEQWSLMFSILLRVSLCCYESELKPNALSVGKAAIDLSSWTMLRGKVLIKQKKSLQ